MLFIRVEAAIPPEIGAEGWFPAWDVNPYYLKNERNTP
jgi:hypothetical protein